MTSPGGGSLGTLFVGVRPGTSRFQPELTNAVTDAGNKAADAAGPGMGRRLAGNIGKALALGTGVLAVGLAKGLASTVREASDLNETISKSQVVFGKHGAAIRQWAQNAATDMGQSTKAAIDGATTFAIYGKSAGLAGKDLFNFSTDLSGLASDMASFSNTSPEEAIEAIGAAMRGESDPIEKYGVLLNDATLRHRALKLGIVDTTKNALTPQQRVLATQAELFAQLGSKGSKALGDFERTSAGLANQQRIAKAQVTNLSAEIGQSLLPVAIKATTMFNTRMIPALRAMWQQHGPQIVAFLSTATTKFSNWVSTIDQADVAGWMNRARAAFATATPVVQKFVQNFREGSNGASLSDTIRVTGVAMNYLADHADLLAKAMPYVVAGLVAYKVSQLAANVAAIAAPIATTLNARATRALAKSNLELAASNVARTGTTVAATAATTVGTTATGKATIATRLFGGAVRFAMGPLGIIITVLGLVTAAVIYLYQHNETARRIIDGAWKWIKNVIAGVGNWITGTLWPSLKRAYDQGATAVKFMVAVWRFQFNLAKNIITTVVNGVIGTFNKVKTFVTVTLPNGFKSGVAIISKYWDALKEKAAAPVRFVVNTVFNGIGGVFNQIAGFLHLPDSIRFPTFKANFAQGGLFSGRLPGAASDVDNMVARGPGGRPIGLAGGEFVVRARQTAKHLPLLQALNSGVEGFADGGLIGFLTNPAGWLKGKVSGTIGRIREFTGNSHIGQVLIGMADRLRDGAIDRLKSFIGGLFGGGAAGNGTGALKGLTAQMVAAAKQVAAMTGMHVSSGLRPGAITVTGNRSYHGYGRAADFVPPSMRSFNIMRTLFAYARELIYSPAGSRQIHNGQPHMYTGAVRATHWDHIHLALARGGLARKFDSGGIWPTGTIGVNTSGRNEVVASGATMDDVAALMATMVAILRRLAPDLADALSGTFTTGRTLARAGAVR